MNDEPRETVVDEVPDLITSLDWSRRDYSNILPRLDKSDNK